MAIILNNKKSTYDSPYAYYTVEILSVSNRESTSVDLEMKITSNLANASSRLGSGYTLKANFDFLGNGDWSNDITLKSSNDSWSGTTKHYKPVTITVNGLSSTDTLLDKIKFRVVSSASDHAAGLNSTACSSVEIPSSHTPPKINTYTMQELNSDLIAIGVTGRLVVDNLSLKSIVFDYELYDDAHLQQIIITSGNRTFTSNTNYLEIDCVGLSRNDNYIYLTVTIIDDKGGESGGGILLNYVPYTKPYIIETTTKVKRIGQLSGNVGLTINGNYYNDEIVENVRPSIQHIYYKYWEVGTTEPATYVNEIPSASITASNGEFSVNNYVVSNINSQRAYRFKIKVEDDYSSVESSELSVAVGVSVWDEYKDRVDFKKLTVKGDVILPTKIIYATPTTDISFTSTSDVKVPLEQNIQIGDNFSISNDDGIVIGANVNVIKINAQLWFSTGFNSGDSCRLSIYKNNDRIAEAGARVENSNAYESISIVSKLLEVQQGDIIYMYGRNATGGRGSCSNTDNIAFLTIERLS